MTTSHSQNAAAFDEKRSVAELLNTSVAGQIGAKGVKGQADHDAVEERPQSVLPSSAQISAQLQTFSDDWLERLSSHHLGNDLSDAYPPTLLQASLLLETAAEVALNWTTILFSVDSAISNEDVRSAFERTAESCEILRTTFITTAEGFVQGILRANALRPILDWHTTSDSTVIAERKAIVPSQLNRRHLYWAATFVTNQPKASTLALHIHRAIYDDASLTNIVSRVNAAILRQPLKDALSTRNVLEQLGATALAWTGQPPTHGRSPWLEKAGRFAHRASPWSYPNLSGSRMLVSKSRMHHASAPITIDCAAMKRASQDHELASCIDLINIAFGSLLADYLEQGAVVLATDVSERTRHPSLETASFPLVHLVPLLTEGGLMTEAERQQADLEEQDGVVGRTTVGEALKSVAEQRAQLMNHPYMSAREIRRSLNWPHDQVLYAALVRVRQDGRQAATAAIAEDPIVVFPDQISEPTKYGLMLTIKLDHTGDPHSIEVSAIETFLSARHTEILATQIDVQVRAVTEAALRKPETPLCRLNILDGRVGRPNSVFDPQLVSVQPPKFIDENTAAAPERHPCHWLRHWAYTAPDRVAVSELIAFDSTVTPRSRSWSYQKLDRMSDRMCQMFQAEFGLQKSQRVALCMNRTLEAFACILAIFKAGCVYLPIAEDLPEERKRDLIADADAQVVLVSPTLKEPFDRRAMQAKIVQVHQIEDSPLPPDMIPRLSEARSCGYLLYTSGSTGKPKGVAVSGANLSAYLEGFATLMLKHSMKSKELSQTGDARYLNLASRAFDPHLSQMFTPWRIGYCAVTGERSLLLEDLPKTISTLNITHIGILPSLLEQSGLTPDLVPSLVGITVGGEKITPFILDVWAPDRATPDTQPLVINAYGPTEVTIGCSMAVVTKSTTPGNIGFPLGATTAIIMLPGTQTLARRGQAGELCFAGDLVAHGGYLGRAPADQGGFSTWTDVDGQTKRIYRSGDMARMLDDGSLSFLGRADEQIKIRGQRLELGEVNATIKAAAAEIQKIPPSSQKSITVYVKHPNLPAPRLFSILARSDVSVPSGSAVKFIDYVTDKEAEALAESVTKYCAHKMPSFMTPTVVMAESIPQLPSGKFDVKRTTKALLSTPIKTFLREAPPHSQDPTKSDFHTDPLNAMEKAILAIICEMTHSQVEEMLPCIRPTTSIFELGIDSLSAVGLAFRLKDPPLAVPISVADIVEHDTIQALAAHAQHLCESSELKAENVWYDPAGFDASVRRELSSEQQLYVQWIRPAMPMQESLITATSLAHQEGAGLGRKNPVLPYIQSFRIAPRQTKSATAVLDMWNRAIELEPILRTCFLEPSRMNKLVQTVLSPEASSLRDVVKLGKVPADVYAQIIEQSNIIPPLRVYVDASTAEATVHIHHSLYDGQTLPSLFADVYQSRRDRRVPTPSNSQDNEILASAERAQGPAALHFWRQYLDIEHMQARKLLTSSSGRGSRTTPGKIKRNIPSLAVERLRAVAASRTIGTTLSNLLQTCFALVLARQTGSCEVMLGNVVMGRTSIEIEQGSRMPCVATVPVKHSFGNNESITDALVTSKRSIASIRKWQHTSLRTINALAGRGDLFEVLFSYDVALAGDAVQHGYQICEDNVLKSHQRIDYPLVLNLVEHKHTNSLDVTLAFTSEDVSDDRASALVAQFLRLLEIAVSVPTTSLSDLSVPTTPAQIAPRVPSQDDRALSPREEQVRNVLLKVLKDVKAEDIHAYTNFYRIGLDSLVALRVAKDLKQKVEGFESVTAATIIEKGFLAALCQTDEDVFQQQSENSKPKKNPYYNHNPTAAVPKLPFTPLNAGDNLEAIYECPPLQSGMLTMSQHSGSAYAQVHRFRLFPEVDLDRLRRAWELVVSCNDVLRTTFHLDEESSKWVGQVHTSVPTLWIDEKKSEEARPGPKPPAWVCIVPDTSGRYIAEFNIHHWLYDGTSLPFIFEQLQRAYDSQRLESPSEHFYSAAAWLSSHRATANEIWSHMLKEYEYAPLPYSHFDLPGHRWRATLQLDRALDPVGSCRAMGVSLHTVCLSAFAKVLASSVLSRRDVCFGHVLDGRNSSTDSGAAQIVGPLFNTVARRVRFGDLLETNHELAERIQKQLDSTIVVQSSADLKAITAEWRRQSRTVHVRLFDALFVYHKARPKTNSSVSKLWKSKNEDAPQEDAEYDLNVSFVQSADSQLKITANASDRAMKGQRELRAFLADTAAVVEDILRNPSNLILDAPASMRSLPLSSPVKQASDQAVFDECRPLNDDEEALCDAVEVVLPSLKVSNWRKIAANIVELGIDSITAIRLASLCRKRGKGLMHVTPTLILHLQTVHQIVSTSRDSGKDTVIYQDVSPEDADRVRLQALKKLQEEVTSLEDDDIEDVSPVLAGQEHHIDLWYNTGCRFYEVPWVLQENNIKELQLRQAWQQLLGRHSLLRSTFVAFEPTQAVQVYFKEKFVRNRADPPGWAVVTVDNDQQVKSRAEDLVRQSNASPSNLYTLPIQCTLVRSPKRGFIIVRIHHAMYDAWSMIKILTDFFMLYKGQELQAAGPDFAQYARRISAASWSDSHQRWWNKYLVRAQTTRLNHGSRDISARGPQSFIRRPQAVKKLSDLEDRVRVAAIPGVNLSHVVILATLRTLAQLSSGLTRPIVGFYSASRSQVASVFPEIAVSAVPLLNVLPLTVDVTDGTCQSLQGIRDDLLERVTWEQSRLRELTKHANAGSPLFDVFLNLLWHRGDGAIEETPSASSPSSTGWMHCRTEAAAEYFRSSHLAEPEKTALGPQYDTSYLANHKTFLDIRRDAQRDCLAFGFKADVAMFGEDEGQADAVLSRLADELTVQIEAIVGSL